MGAAIDQGAAQMKTPRPTQNAERGAHDKRKFTGTCSPRHLRALTVLLQRPVSRQDLDGVAGVTNSPELVAELRRRGLDLPCERIKFTDRDGKLCRPGVYALSERDRRLVNEWMDARSEGGAA